MRLTRHITLILALLLGATPGARGAADWSWSIDASTAQEGWFTGGEFGARATTLDGFDTKDLLIQPGIRAYIGTYHETGLGDWTGPTGFFRRDLRAPWSSASPILIWDIGVWMDPSVPSQADFIKVGWTRLSHSRWERRLPVSIDGRSRALRSSGAGRGHVRVAGALAAAARRRVRAPEE